MNVVEMTEVIGGKRYSTRTAILIASDAYWDGHNVWDRDGRNTFLFRTPNGAYFAQHRTRWPGERDRLEALTQDEAITLYESLPEKEIAFEEAFPNVKITDA